MVTKQSGNNDKKGENEMNKVKFFYDTNGKQIEKEINEFALKHKIINVSYAVDQSSSGYYSAQAMVLYEEKITHSGI